MKRKLIYLFVLPTILIIALIYSSYVHAQETRLDLTTSPVFFEFSATPGQEIKDKIRLRNNASSPIPLKVEIKALASGETGDVQISDLSSRDEAADWVELGKKDFSAPAREWVDIPFTIKVPQSAAFGYYFAFAITQNTPLSGPDQPVARLMGSVAVPVLLNVKKAGAKIEGKLVEFKPKSYINEFLPVEFTTRVSNVGNVHIRPRGNIFIRGAGDKQIGTLEVNEGLGSILPNGTRVFESEWNDGFLVNEKITEDGKFVKDDNGNFKTKLKINWNKLTDFRMGPYTAYLLIVYDDGTRDVPLEATVSFWVLPYKIIGGAVIGLAILIFLVRLVLKQYIKSQLKRAR